MFLLQKGVIEAYVISEGKEFILERLYRGSVIDYITFFQNDYHGDVFMRCATKVTVKVLSLAAMKRLCEEYPVLRKTFDTFQILIAKQDKYEPLNYIVVLPPQVKAKLAKKTDELLKDERVEEIHLKIEEKNKSRGGAMNEKEEEEFINKHLLTRQERSRFQDSFLRLRNVFKNIVMRKFVALQKEHNKLSISQVVSEIIKRNQENEAKKRRKIKKKIERKVKETRDTALAIGDIEDMLYSRTIF
jgi:CRP-like cAMP-binding protein